MSAIVRQKGEYNYIEEGQGKPLILLHGLFGGLSNFTDVIERFKGNYRVIIPQLPIYTMPVLTTGVGSLAKFVEGFMREMDIPKAILLGNSLGGHVSLVFSKNNPEMVERLILTGSSGLYENAFGGSTPRRGDREYIRQKVLITFYDPNQVTDALVDECFDTINDKGKLLRVLALAKSAIRHNMADDLPALKMKTCLIWGKNDKITPPEVAEEFNKLMPNSELFWIDKCGHAPMMEQPAEFNNILAAWLAKTEQ
ncbi:MAG: alpha/beta fold hydrolase [Bacteroidota bacterium]